VPLSSCIWVKRKSYCSDISSMCLSFILIRCLLLRVRLGPISEHKWKIKLITEYRARPLVTTSHFDVFGEVRLP
jgi:hypothetical protein